QRAAPRSLGPPRAASRPNGASLSNPRRRDVPAACDGNPSASLGMTGKTAPSHHARDSLAAREVSQRGGGARRGSGAPDRRRTGRARRSRDAGGSEVPEGHQPPCASAFDYGRESETTERETRDPGPFTRPAPECYPPLLPLGL